MGGKGWQVCAPALAFALALGSPAPAAAQESYERDSEYERRYGQPVDVSITDLVQNSAAYENRAVRTRGRLELLGGLRDGYGMRDGFNAAAIIRPVEEVRGNFEQDALGMMGREVEITGVMQRLGDPGTTTGMGGQAMIGILFWAYQGPPEDVKVPKDAPSVTLESLVTNPGRRDGQTVRVVGKFRGRNLYGDLPSRSQRAGGDWVIKDEAFAVWVTSRKPKGKGFDLDSSLKRDTGKWIEVIGRPTTRGGVTYIQAIQVALSGPPTPTAAVAPPPPPPERPKVPPVIVFAMPLDGEGEVPIDTRFVVQFNKDMDETTFDGRVLLRYAGPVLPGDQPLNATKVTYDKGRRALTVDPGMMLAPGRQLELILMPGIIDLEGLSLSPRGPAAADGAADVLRFSIGI
jgi:hypothetical protein